MWRSIASRSINFSSKLSYLQNPLFNSSKFSILQSFHAQNRSFSSDFDDISSSDNDDDITSSGASKSKKKGTRLDRSALDRIDYDLYKRYVENPRKVSYLLESSSNNDGSLEKSLDKLKLDLNHMKCILKVFANPNVEVHNLNRFFKWVVSKNVYEVDTFVETLIIKGAYSYFTEFTKISVSSLWDVLKENGVVNAKILNSVLGKLSRTGQGMGAFEVFGKFEEFGFVPNADTYYHTIKALTHHGNKIIDCVTLVVQKMIDDEMLPDSEKVGDVVIDLSLRERFREAYNVYVAARRLNKLPSLKAVNTLIYCLSLSEVDENVKLAKEMVLDYPGEGEAREHAMNALLICIRGLCRIKDIEGAKKLFAERIEKGPSPRDYVEFCIMIISLCEVGLMEEAREMLNLMKKRRIKPYVDCSISFPVAKNTYSKLCSSTIFVPFIQGYCNLGEYDKALELMAKMDDYGVEPNAEVIETLCLNALDLKSAEKLLEHMNEKGLDLLGIQQGLINAVKKLKRKREKPFEIYWFDERSDESS